MVDSYTTWWNRWGEERMTQAEREAEYAEWIKDPY